MFTGATVFYKWGERGRQRDAYAIALYNLQTSRIPRQFLNEMGTKHPAGWGPFNAPLSADLVRAITRHTGSSDDPSWSQDNLILSMQLRTLVAIHTRTTSRYDAYNHHDRWTQKYHRKICQGTGRRSGRWTRWPWCCRQDHGLVADEPPKWNDMRILAA